MSTHSNQFIIYLAIKRFCIAMQFIVSKSICYKVSNFSGFKRIKSPAIFLNAIIFKNSKYLVNNILLFKLLCVDVGGYSFIRNEFWNKFRTRAGWKMHILYHHSTTYLTLKICLYILLLNIKWICSTKPGSNLHLDIMMRNLIFHTAVCKRLFQIWIHPKIPKYKIWFFFRTVKPCSYRLIS